MVAVTEDFFHLFAHKARTDRKSAAESFRGGNNIGGNAVVHVCVHLTCASVARLHLVNHKENVIFLGKRRSLLHKFTLQHIYAALALNALDKYAANLIVLNGFAHRVKIVCSCMNKAGCKRLKKLVIMRLTGCRKGGKRSAMKTVFKRYNSAVFAALFLRAVLACNFNCTLVCLRARVAEKDLCHARFLAEKFGKATARLGVIKV